MRGIIRTLAGSGLIAGLALLATAPEAKGQGAIGFQPTVSPFGDGVFLNATPAVTADRRYVRLGGINASFQALQGVQPFTFPAGAVAGGGFGGPGFGGPGFGGIGGPGFGNMGVGNMGVGNMGFGAPGFGNMAVGNMGFGGAAVVPGLGAVAPVGFGYPGFYGGYPYTVTGFPTRRVPRGPFVIPSRTVNMLVPTGNSIMNAVAPGTWRGGPR